MGAGALVDGELPIDQAGAIVNGTAGGSQFLRKGSLLVGY